ncbi:hypothetical protein FHS74_000865 [Nitrospirillum iridis]|uniref:Transposase n=1 Tax=Nitrospirillum iridis TaxID=765888 RepID=A0A7X0AUG6_9PROT|nr:hypothetical protein [Nitrospirillum iridis]
MAKRQKSIAFQRTLSPSPLLAADFPTAAAYAGPCDIIPDVVDDRLREMFCDAVAEPLPLALRFLLARLRGGPALN